MNTFIDGPLGIGQEEFQIVVLPRDDTILPVTRHGSAPQPKPILSNHQILVGSSDGVKYLKSVEVSFAPSKRSEVFLSKTTSKPIRQNPPQSLATPNNPLQHSTALTNAP